MHEKVGVEQHWLTPHSRKWGSMWPRWPHASAVYVYRYIYPPKIKLSKLFMEWQWRQRVLRFAKHSEYWSFTPPQNKFLATPLAMLMLSENTTQKHGITTLIILLTGFIEQINHEMNNITLTSNTDHIKLFISCHIWMLRNVVGANIT